MPSPPLPAGAAGDGKPWVATGGRPSESGGVLAVSMGGSVSSKTNPAFASFLWATCLTCVDLFQQFLIFQQSLFLDAIRLCVQTQTALPLRKAFYFPFPLSFSSKGAFLNLSCGPP